MGGILHRHNPAMRGILSAAALLLSVAAACGSTQARPLRGSTLLAAPRRTQLTRRAAVGGALCGSQLLAPLGGGLAWAAAPPPLCDQDVSVLRTSANKEIVIVGTAHVSEESAALVRQVVRQVRPDTVMVELDKRRAVALMRKADHLPLIKPYLQAVQNTNIVAINDAVNELCLEEEDFESLRTSIDTYDNFDQMSLANKCEKHELLEFRRIAGFLYQKNAKWTKSVELSKKDGLYKDAMEAAAQSGDKDIAGDLLQFFIEQENKECFAAMLYNCYDLLKPDEVLEIAWMKGLMEYAMPYMIQVMKDYTNKVDVLVEDKKDRTTEKAEQEKEKVEQQMNQNMYAQLLPAALPAPGMETTGGMNGMNNPGMYGQMGGVQPGMYGGY